MPSTVRATNRRMARRSSARTSSASTTMSRICSGLTTNRSEDSASTRLWVTSNTRWQRVPDSCVQSVVAVNRLGSASAPGSTGVLPSGGERFLPAYPTAASAGQAGERGG